MIYVGFDHLEPNKLYYIEQNILGDIKKSIGKFIRHETTMYYEVACFQNIKEFNTQRKKSYDYNFHRGCNYYEAHKFDIQREMEKRSFVQIMKKIIPDENFISSIQIP